MMQYSLSGIQPFSCNRVGD